MAIPTRFVKGSTIEEKFASVETTLRHFSRRLQKAGAVIVPPIPIFARSASSGIIFSGFVPYKGTVTAAAIAIGKFITRPAIVTFKAISSAGEVSITVPCDNRHTTRDLGLTLAEPSVLEIEVTGAEDILVSVLTQINLPVTYKEMLLLDAVLHSYEVAEDLEEE